MVDLCPVGSLISKDFLHKARAWELDKTGSICPGCSQGCNITIETRDDTVVRLKPRPNMDVNRHFMCDTGRLDYRWMNRGDRIEAPLVRQGAKHVAADWDSALDRLGRVAGGSGRAVILASGRASVESLGLVKSMLGSFDVTAAVRVPTGPEAPLAGVPNLALRSERAANVHGAERLGYTRDWAGAMSAAEAADLVVVLDASLDAQEEQRLQEVKGTLVVLGTVVADFHHRAELVLPVTTMAEENGVYVNRDGRAQRYMQARSQPGMARPAWWIAGEVLAGPGPDASAPASAADAFDEVGRRYPAFADLSHRSMGWVGQQLRETAGAAR